jgi:predicted transcriptional regulator
MESHRAAPADLRTPEELSRPAKDRRFYRGDVEGYSQTDRDRRRIFKMLVMDYLEALNEEDMVNIIHDGNLSDRQMHKVLAVLLHRSGYIEHQGRLEPPIPLGSIAS